MGLFDFFKKPISSDNSKNNEQVKTNSLDSKPQEKPSDDFDLAYQTKLLNRVNEAQRKYKEDGNLSNVIKELEFAFIESNPPCITSQNLDLATYYLKNGQNDKAWSYLNKLQIEKSAPLKDIRFAQANVLKKECKWKSAIQMYMLSYLAKSKWNQIFQKDMFLKDIKPICKKLNWDESITDQLSKMVEKHVIENQFNERSLIDEYQLFCKEICK